MKKNRYKVALLLFGINSCSFIFFHGFNNFYLEDRKIINYHLYYIGKVRAWKTSAYCLKKLCFLDSNVIIDVLPDDYFDDYNIKVEITSIDDKVMIKRY